MIIRHFKDSDAKALWEILFHTVRNINIRDYTLEQVEAWAPNNFELSIWRDRIKPTNPIVAEISGVVVGFTDLQPDGLIDHFFCHHEYQGQGVGRGLMNYIFTLGQKQDVKRYYSEVSITARQFFEHFGFKVTQEQEVEIRGCKLKNFIMEKIN
jgi:putative acetyltransferase